MDKKPTIEELKRLADKLSKAVLAAGEPERPQPVRDLMAVSDLANLARTLSARAMQIGEPEASILLRMASIQLSGGDRRRRSEDAFHALEELKIEAEL